MRYINKTLLQNERLAYISRPHWIIFASAGTMALITLFIAVYPPIRHILNFNFFNFSLHNIVLLITGGVTIYWLLIAFITYKTSEYAITDRRVLIKVGWISRDALEIFLDKVEAVRVDQTVLGRILKYGTIIIIGTGGTKDAFPYVPDPLGFRKKVQQQLDLFEHSLHE